MIRKFFIEDGPSSIDLWLSLVGKLLYVYFTVGHEGGTTNRIESTAITLLGVKSEVRASHVKEPLSSLSLEDKILVPTQTEPYIVFNVEGYFVQSTILGKPMIIPFEGWYDPQKRQGDIVIIPEKAIA